MSVMKTTLLLSILECIYSGMDSIFIKDKEKVAVPVTDSDRECSSLSESSNWSSLEDKMETG